MNNTEVVQASRSQPAPERPSKRGWKRLVKASVLVLALLLAYLAFWPAPIDPVAYEPPPMLPLLGLLAPNDRLRSALFVATGLVDGPEDVELDAEGRIYTGTADGWIVRVEPDGSVTKCAKTGGRPLGIALDAQGNLIVADGIKGLLSIGPDKTVTTLVTQADGVELGFTDDVDVAQDGTVYFSDASSKFGPGAYLYDMLEGRPHGRLLRYSPATKQVEVLLKELCFANGVALSQNEDFVLVNETYRYRVTRYWLKGQRAGTSDTFIDNLPGFPDNITSNGQGTFWLALFTVRNDMADWLAPKPFVKQALSKLPSFLWPQPQPYAFVVKLDETGAILDSLQDPTGQHLHSVTSVQERDGYLYLGSLYNDRIGKYKLPDGATDAQTGQPPERAE
jgi:sugar lactone lactonase YvrE